MLFLVFFVSFVARLFLRTTEFRGGWECDVGVVSKTHVLNRVHTGHGNSGKSLNLKENRFPDVESPTILMQVLESPGSRRWATFVHNHKCSEAFKSWLNLSMQTFRFPRKNIWFIFHCTTDLSNVINMFLWKSPMICDVRPLKSEKKVLEKSRIFDGVILYEPWLKFCL